MLKKPDCNISLDRSGAWIKLKSFNRNGTDTTTETLANVNDSLKRAAETRVDKNKNPWNISRTMNITIQHSIRKFDNSMLNLLLELKTTLETFNMSYSGNVYTVDRQAHTVTQWNINDGIVTESNSLEYDENKTHDVQKLVFPHGTVTVY